MFPWNYVDGLWSTKSEVVWLIVRISNFSHLRGPDAPTSQTDGQIDGRCAVSIPHYALVLRVLKRPKMTGHV